MFGNMVTSLFRHERIITTKVKGKELKRVSERLITRAKRNIGLSAENEGKKLHNKREVMKIIKDRDIVEKLFNDIALRFKERNGGYTRMYLLGKRRGDAADMSIVELVDKKIIAKKVEDKDKDAKDKDAKKELKVKKEKTKKAVKEADAKVKKVPAKETEPEKETKEKKKKKAKPK
jgi:large subunit ribosomal protein L17